MTLQRPPRGKFVNQKVSKIRWRPAQTKSGRITATHFVTGSWDDNANSVCLWSWAPTPSEFLDNSASDVTATDSKLIAEPELLGTFDHSIGDVNDLQFLTSDHVVVASSDGSVTLLSLGRDASLHYTQNIGWSLNQVAQWKQVHQIESGLKCHFPAKSSCNGISCFASDVIATVGEDGKLAILNPKNTKQAVRSFTRADSCSLTGVKFIKNDEVATINMVGQLKLWDLRANTEEPSRTCLISTEQIGLTCIARHPVQPHVLVTGCNDGVLAFWDLRMESHPVTLLSGHSMPVSEVQFHEQQPEHLFSCSQSGDVLHWNGSLLAKSSAAAFLNFANQGSKPNVPVNNTGCVWLNSDAVKHRVETTKQMSMELPVNSIDVCGSSLLAAADNEAIYLVENIVY